jgi:hypothetical protein
MKQSCRDCDDFQPSKIHDVMGSYSISPQREKNVASGRSSVRLRWHATVGQPAEIYVSWLSTILYGMEYGELCMEAIVGRRPYFLLEYRSLAAAVRSCAWPFVCDLILLYRRRSEVLR